MAQNIILKRSALPGKVPDTGSLNLGEIALNTYDGRAFIHKSGSTESIEHIVVTNSITTGSISITQTGSFGEISVENDINVSGSLYVTTDIVGNGDIDISGDITGSNAILSGTVTANTFVGNGAQLTNIVVDDGLPDNNWDFNIEDTTAINDFQTSSVVYLIDFNNLELVGTEAGKIGWFGNTTGQTQLIPANSGLYIIAGDRQVGYVTSEGYSGSIVGIGNVSSFSSSVDSRINNLGGAGGVISGSSQITNLGFATTGSNTFTGLQTFQQVQEVISLKPSLGLGTNNFDFNSGSIFYIAGLTGSGTWNVQNIPSASNAATSITFVIEQGATAYSASAYQLGGTSVSVKWLDGTIPTGSASSTDIIGLTAFRSGSSWNVVGSLSKFS